MSISIWKRAIPFPFPPITIQTLHHHRHPLRRPHSSLPSTPTPLSQTLTPRQKEQICLYVAALLDWNQRMNLTAVREESAVMTRHVEDSLAVIPHIRRAYASNCGRSGEKLRLVDVGTGAGLPGLIFAVACPGWEVTLLDSLNKRCLFLEHAVDVMSLSNVQILCDRAEDRT